MFENIAAEEVILGTIMTNSNFFNRVSDILKEEHFSDPCNKIIYEEIVRLDKEGKGFNYITINNFFNQENLSEAKGGEYLKYLLAQASAIYSIRDYAFIIIELWQKRNLNQKLHDALENLKSESFDKVSLNLENEIAGLNFQGDKKKTEHMEDIVKNFTLEDDTIRIPTGIAPLDKVLNGGLAKKEITVLGARSGCGKTTLAQNIILNASKVGKKCLFISLEVDKRSLLIKFLSNMSSVDSRRISSNNLSQTEIQSINHSKNIIKDYNIYVNDSSSLNIFEIEKIIKQQLKRNPVDLVVVDYLQLVKTSGRNRVEEISQVSKCLKKIASTFDLAVLVLAQVNRDGADTLPRLQHLKGSGAIEEDADVVIFVHRDTQEQEGGGVGMAETGKLIIAKGRNIGIGDVDIRFEGKFSRFSEAGSF